jgi:hypothetical protein
MRPQRADSCRLAILPWQSLHRRCSRSKNIQKAKYEALSVSLPEALDYREGMNRGGSLSETRDKKLNARAQHSSMSWSNGFD